MRNSNPPRILICGPSGTGKSELANFISLSLGILFISTSTKPLWPKHDIETHEELIKKGQKNPDWGNDFQVEVLDYRRDLLDKEVGGYVCDRSPIDNLVYYMMQNSMDMGQNASDRYASLCAEDLVNQADFIIRIKFKPDYEMMDDGKRISNKYFQLMTDGVFESVFQNDLLNIGNTFQPKQLLVIDTWDWNERIKMVQKFLNINPNVVQEWVRKIKK